MGFKENLRALREQSDLTQTEMANKAGVPFRSYQNWEAGSREPRIKALAALAAAFKTTVDELLKGELDAPDAPPPPKPAKGKTSKAKGPAGKPTRNPRNQEGK